MAQLYILVEHAAGYGVFKVKEFEEIGMLLPQLENAIGDLARFNSVVQIVGFSPFKTGVKALENINAVSEGILPDDLQQFLDITVPKSKKKSQITLGVEDPKLAIAITEALGIECSHAAVVLEAIRGIKYHFHNLVKGLTKQSSTIARLGLGHSFSRTKVKFNINRVDNMIIHSIALLDQLDKDINTFSMRIREWYSYHFPELVKIIPENYTFARLAKFIKNRKELSEESLEALEEITMDSGKAHAILSASRSSMGMDINPVDLINIEKFADQVVGLVEYRKQLSGYLERKMKNIAPNLASLIGDQVGARLIAHAGSLMNLAKCAASTVQILGAEKALFRALKTRGNTPKYGLLFHSTFIGRAGAKNKGRISRYLANKCTIASRIDCFTDSTTQVFGEKLRQQVEDRLKFYETGDVPKTNIEVMEQAIEEVVNEAQILAEKKKKKKKKRKSEGVDESVVEEISVLEDGSSETPSKKKKKKKSETSLNGTSDEINSVLEDENSEALSKKKKKRKSEGVTDESLNGTGVEEENTEKVSKKKKKRKHDEISNETTSVEFNNSTVEEENGGEPPKKKKKKKNKQVDE